MSIDADKTFFFRKLKRGVIQVHEVHKFCNTLIFMKKTYVHWHVHWVYLMYFMYIKHRVDVLHVHKTTEKPVCRPSRLRGCKRHVGGLVVWAF